MSRVPPYPPDSSRRPGSSNLNGSGRQGSFPTTRPLQINRTPTRPTTPSRSSALAGSPEGPARPTRSGLRSAQASQYSTSDRTSMDSRLTRDSGDPRDAYADSPSSQSTRYESGSSSYYNGRSAPGGVPISPTSETEISPTSQAVIAAFQSFGRRRATIDKLVDKEYEEARRKEQEIQQLRQQKIQQRVPGRRPVGRARAGDIDAVLDEIQDGWQMVTDPNFNPVDLALQLLDGSSLGKDMASFRRTKDTLSRALKGSVDQHYQAFNAALPHHAALLSHFGMTQTQITEARMALQEAKDTLGGKRSDLVQLWSRSQTVEEMVRILNQIEHLKSVPDALESLISEKRLLQAAVLLVRSMKSINKPDMLEIGALSDLRSYLNSQEVALRDILIDELHSHLYLKSFWCESRWSVYTPGQQTFPAVEFDEVDSTAESKPSLQPAQTPTSPTSTRSTRLSRYLNDLALRPNEPPIDVNDHSVRSSIPGTPIPGSSSVIGLSSIASMNSLAALSGVNAALMPGSAQSAPNQNPEADSFLYIETLLESLAVLGKLGNALDAVAQKLPGEIFSLVEATIDEVEERAEFGRRMSIMVSAGPSSSGGRPNSLVAPSVPPSGMTLDSGIAGVAIVPDASASAGQSGRSVTVRAISLRLAALESTTKHMDQETLRDFFWTLYSKLEAVAQGLRVVYEVANRIGSRRDFKDSSGAKPGSLFPLAELWMPVQAEVRTLLSDYINDEEQGTVTGRNPISSINEVLRESKFSRDKTKPVFRFADTDVKSSSKLLKQHEDELTRVLKDTVPGLVQGSSDNAVQATLSAVGTDDRMLGTGQHHRLLVRPDAFHVSVLFQPTLAYLDRVAEVLPSGLEAARQASVVLDEFVLKVYLPQLEDKISLVFHHAITSPDAFEPDAASKRLSPRPLVKVAVQLMALVNSLCSMLRTTPFHRENYSRLILTVIGQFYQRCSDRFQELATTRDDGAVDSDLNLALAAQWAQTPELYSCLSDLFKAAQDDGPNAKKAQLRDQETQIEIKYLGQGTVQKRDLVASARNLSSLACLYHSVTWFAAELRALASVPEGAISPSAEPQSSLTPYTPYLQAAIPVQSNEQLRLPLSSAMAMRFQALHMTYTQLAELILHTIRIDIRCRVMHHLDLGLRHGVYRIEREASEPDPHIVDLNVEIGKCDDAVTSALPELERRFVFYGLGHLMEDLLISKARYIRSANAMGVRKMMRNVLALQQNMKTIVQDSRNVEFNRAKRYYSLFFIPPQDMISGIRQKQEFTFDEYKTMLDLQCGVDPNGGLPAGQPTDRNYNMYVIDLHGLELENPADGIS
ncbi:hypothetical protein OBBRIDRAFT_769063 [Obba rivulosa]|uniref:Exocyst complex component Sec8 n=1 Tax=Obba rivulosa TaxID=1052685 RepID=A0A8E2DS44_9APHY|nr:hypothetical protein OBBRIDRAFT_769063 [Obba rivulosa]